MATARYRQVDAAHEAARKELAAAVVAALRAGKRPTDIAAKTPFTVNYVHRIARDNGVPDYMLSRYPEARAELEAAFPEWRAAAKAISDLNVGLDDSEYVGGVLWYGLTSPGAKRSSARQKRIITNRLTRWVIRNGGSNANVARALGEVLDKYL